MLVILGLANRQIHASQDWKKQFVLPNRLPTHGENLETE